MVDVLEQLELDRLAWPLDRLHAVDDRPTDAANEMAVEEVDRGRQMLCQFGFPVEPVVETEIALRDPLTGVLKQVDVVPQLAVGGPNLFGGGRLMSSHRTSCQPK